MDRRYESIHEFRNFLEVRWEMTANINWLFTKSAAELRNIRDGNVVQSPERVFIKCGVALLQPYLHAVGQEIVLPEKILFLHEIVKLAVVAFGNNHAKKEPTSGALSVQWITIWRVFASRCCSRQIELYPL
jgi:hypothetical protein